MPTLSFPLSLSIIKKSTRASICSNVIKLTKNVYALTRKNTNILKAEHVKNQTKNSNTNTQNINDTKTCKCESVYSNDGCMFLNKCPTQM